MPDKNDIPYGYCHCGCGEKTRCYPANNKNRGWVKDRPRKWLPGHNSYKHFGAGANPTGLCGCGCGGQTPLAIVGSAVTGDVIGKPIRFIHGHNKMLAVEYVEEDRGYDTPCWIWQGALDRGGYGRKRGRATNRAHRVYYERVYGPIDDGLPLDHLCRVRCCVNPKHLEPVTAGENTRRGDRTRLGPKQVREIRSSTDSQRVLGERYNVHPTTISAIILRRSWKDVH